MLKNSLFYSISDCRWCGGRPPSELDGLADTVRHACDIAGGVGVEEDIPITSAY